MALHIVLVDTPTSDGWHGPSGLFREAAATWAAQGHDVRLIEDHVAAASTARRPLLTGLNRAGPASPLTNSHRLACDLARNPPDLIIAPLRGGIAQSVLMARACGEAFVATRIALWSNQPTRERFLASDSLVFDLGTLIADAMERQCLSLADALILPDPRATPPALPNLDCRIRRVACSSLAAATTAVGSETQIREIVFVGALERAAGAGEFIEAIERLARKGILGDRLVTFVGPMAESVQGLSKEWLGQKASAWPFRFRVIEESDRSRAVRYASEAGRLAVTVTPDGHELQGLRSSGGRHVGLLARPMHDGHLATRVENAIARALANDEGTGGDGTRVDWPRLLDDLAHLDAPPSPSPADSVTVCVLHYNRLRFLRQALASIPRSIDGKPVEVIVIDNASPIPDVERAIREAAADRDALRILVLSEPLPQASAYNRGLAEARSEIVAFLDDDNLFVAGGLERLARAASTAAHDIVVSSLDVFDDTDGDAQAADSAGHLLFLGTAHSAGLFFNAFGDTAMAVRRNAFAALGGFHDLGYDYPSLDWVTLAKAQGASLRIGALQWPAVRYRRNTARADVQAIKLDEAGARTLVFEACGASIDAPLIARYAQKLLLLDL